MSIHISAEPGEIAPAVLLPGDPLRARYIAETFLEDVSCYNEVRAMYGYTGRYGDKRISVQGSGMGMPSLAIYVNELVQEYGVQTIIRVGTCGALQPHLGIGDLVLAMTASTDSHMNRLRFDGKDYAPAADFDLLLQAYNAAKARGYTVEVGSIVTSDTFYADDDDAWDKWIAYGALACEMETSQLYTLAAKFRIRALSILTVSNSLVTGEEATAEQRERDFPRMAEVALDIVS